MNILCILSVYCKDSLNWIELLYLRTHSVLPDLVLTWWEEKPHELSVTLCPTTTSSLPKSWNWMLYGGGYDKKKRERGKETRARWRRRTVNHLFVCCIQGIFCQIMLSSLEDFQTRLTSPCKRKIWTVCLEEEKAIIFKPFWQLSSLTSRQINKQ